MKVWTMHYYWNNDGDHSASSPMAFGKYDTMLEELNRNFSQYADDFYIPTEEVEKVIAADCIDIENEHWTVSKSVTPTSIVINMTPKDDYWCTWEAELVDVQV